MGPLTRSFQLFSQKSEVLIRPGQGNLVGPAKPDQPTGNPWTGLSLICGQICVSQFSRLRVRITILTVHGSLSG